MMKSNYYSKSLLTLLVGLIFLSFLKAQTDVDLSISSTAGVFNSVNNTVDIQICVTNNSSSANLKSMPTNVQDVEVVMYESYHPDESEVSGTVYSITGTGVGSAPSPPPSFPEDDIVIISNSGGNFNTSAMASNCEEIWVVADAFNTNKNFIIPSITAGMTECFSVTLTVNSNFIGCGLALVSEIYRAKDDMGSFIVDSDSPYDSYSCVCPDGPYPILDDNNDQQLDTDDNITASSFTVCQFQDQDQCIYIPPGDWTLTLGSDVFNLSGPQTYNAANFVDPMGSMATINDGLGCVGTFNVTASGSCSSDPPLPIELSYFKGEIIKNQILLKWRTESELNNDYMAVERSTDGKSFQEIGRVKGAGTTVEAQEYQFWDKSPLFGDNYYRLRQVDLDGSEHFHKIIALSIESDQQLMTVVPTLANDQAQLQFSQPLSEEGEIHIMDINGRVIWRQKVYKDVQNFSLPIQQLSKGTYFVQWITKQQSELIKFMKL